MSTYGSQRPVHDVLLLSVHRLLNFIQPRIEIGKLRVELLQRPRGRRPLYEVPVSLLAVVYEVVVHDVVVVRLQGRPEVVLLIARAAAPRPAPRLLLASVLREAVVHPGFDAPVGRLGRLQGGQGEACFHGGVFEA